MTMMCVVDIYAAASPLPVCSLAGLPIALSYPANIAIAFPL